MSGRVEFGFCFETELLAGKMSFLDQSRSGLEQIEEIKSFFLT